MLKISKAPVGLRSVLLLNKGQCILHASFLCHQFMTHISSVLKKVEVETVIAVIRPVTCHRSKNEIFSLCFELQSIHSTHIG